MARVLVVDDEEDIRELLRVNLLLDGHEVITAAGGAEALERLREEVPDLVILDVLMPGTDGWEVLTRVKADRDPALAGVPVLMLTANDRDVDRIRGGIEGAIRYMTKPFSTPELCREVRLALEGEPEPVQRQRAQRRALEQLARLEQGGTGGAPGARPKLTRLGGAALAPTEPPRQTWLAPARLRSLSDRQRELLRAVAGTASISAAAAELDVSRSGVYASLRRIARKLDAASVPQLVDAVRRQGPSDLAR